MNTGRHEIPARLVSQSRPRPTSQRSRSKRRPRLEALEGRVLLSVTFNEFSTPDATTILNITSGPDGNLWFTDSGTNEVEAMRPDGSLAAVYGSSAGVANFPAGSDPEGITAGGDGNIWFTQRAASQVSVLTTAANATATDPAGTITSIPTQGHPYQITQGPNQPGYDPTVWFTESSPSGAWVGEIDVKTHAIQEFALSNLNSDPAGISVGADGALWFTERAGNAIGRIDANAPNQITEYPIPTTMSQPRGITLGMDDRTWFTESAGNKIGSLYSQAFVTSSSSVVPSNGAVYFPGASTPSFGPGATIPAGVHVPAGTMIEYTGLTSGSVPYGITSGPDGNLWFSECATQKLAEITTTGVVAELSEQVPGFPYGITSGPDGNVWFAEDIALGRANLPGSELSITTMNVPNSPVVVSSGGNNVAPNQLIDYQIPIFSNGPDLAQGVVLTVTLPAGVTFYNTGSGNDGTLSGNTVTFNVGDLAAHTGIIEEVFGTASQAGTYTATANVTCTSPQKNLAVASASASVSVVQGADMAVSSINVSNPAPAVGDDFTYTMTVINNGPDVAKGAVLTDVLPTGLQFLVNGSTGVFDDTTGTFTQDMGDLDPGVPVNVVIHVQATAKGSYSNTATASCNWPDTNAANDSKTVDVSVHASSTSGALRVSVTGTGAAPTSALSGMAVTPAASTEPLVGANGIVTIVVSSLLPFATPTVVLSFDNGIAIPLDNAGQPSVAIYNNSAGDYEFTYVEDVGAAQWPAGTTAAPDNVYISVSGVDLEGDPLSAYIPTGPSFGIVDTTTITASTPTLTLSSAQIPGWGATRDSSHSFETINVPFGTDFQFHAVSAIPNVDSNSSLRLFAAGILPAPLTLTNSVGDPSTQDQTYHVALPALLNGDFKPTSTDIGHTFYLVLDALNLNTQESTAGILKLHVTNSDGTDPGTGGPDFTVSTSPLGFAPPTSGGVVSIDIHVHSDTSPLTTPAIEVFAPGSQTPIPFTGTIYADQLLDGSVDYSNYDAIETFAATDPVGVYRFRVTAQDKSKKYSLNGAGNVYVYDGTPGDMSDLTSQLLQQAQNQPLQAALQLAYTANQIDGGILPGGPVPGLLFVDGTPAHPVVSTVVPTATGFALLDQAGHVIAQGGGNVISHDGGTFTIGGAGSNVTFLNAQGVIAQGGGNVIAQGGGNVIAAGGGNVIAAGGGNVISHDGGTLIAVANSLVANASSSNPVDIVIPGLAAPILSTSTGNFTYNGLQIPLIGQDAAGLIGQDAAGLIGQDAAGIIHDNGAGLVSSLSASAGFANSQSMIQLASSASLASSLATSLPAIATATVVPGPVPLGAGITPSASPASSPPGVANTPLGAAQDAMLYADIMARHELELLQNGQPASVTNPRGDDAIAALNAATVALNQGFAALTPDQLAALQRAGSVIMLNVTPATPGGTVAPGSDVVLTPVNAAEALATSTASAPAGQGGALTLGGSVVTVGGVLPSPLQLGARLNIVPLNGQPAYLRSAAPGQVVAQLPTFLPTDGPQLIVLTTADGRLAIGAVNVQPATGSIQFSAPTYTWGKNGAMANIIVTRTGGSSGTTGAIVSTSDGTAAAGVDYTATSDMVSFADGDTQPRLISIPLLAGDGSSGDKTINLTLSSPLNGASIGTQATATLTLQAGLGTIQGQVFEDQNGDGAIQTGEPGLANALVFIDVNGDGVLNNPVSGNNVGDLNATEPFTVTDSQGHYTLGALAPGSYTVRVVVPGDRTETTAATETVTIDGSGAVVSGGNFGLSPALAAGTPNIPALAAQSDTGASNSDGIVKGNGSTNAPLTFNLSETGAATDFFRLYDVTNPASPILLGGPVQASGGTATITLNGTTLADGVHQFAVTAAATATSPESPVSSTLAITIDTAAPTSTVTALPATSGINIPVSWGGSDNTGGTGVSSYSVFVSDNGGSFTPWLTNTTHTTGTYTGTYGHTYAFYSVATDLAGNAQAAPVNAQATTQTVATPLEVTAVTPSASFLTSLPNNQIVLTFNRALAGLTADKADGSGFKSEPFAVMLLPSGPDGLATQKQTGVFWSAPSGYDSGVLPIPATAVYHLNSNGTSTITLTPHQPLATDIYLITVNGLQDLYGDPLANAAGTAGSFFTSFDYHANPANSTPLKVTTVTTLNGTVPINGGQIPQPDTIGITFNKPLNTYTVNTGTIQLLAKNGSIYTPVASAVAYSPTTNTAYLTPEAALVPGTTYVVSVSGSVSDDQAFPNPGITLGAPTSRTFTVNGPGVTTGSATLTVLKTNPLNGTQWTSALGYGAVTFSEGIDLSSLGRFSAMLIPHTGGVTTGTSGYADVPVNAKLAFNPNTNQLIIVPTGLLQNHTIYLFSLSGIKTKNGSTLSGSAFSTFLLNTTSAAHVLPATAPAAGTVTIPTASAALPAAEVPRVTVRHRTATAPQPARPAFHSRRAAVSAPESSVRWPLGPSAFFRG